eukprot:1157954-Pelagomonas_calceolata.AAC.1
MIIESRSLSLALLLADFGATPLAGHRQLAAGGHLSTQGPSWGPPAGLRVQLEGGMLGTGRGSLAGKSQDITQGCGALLSIQKASLTL